MKAVLKPRIRTEGRTLLQDVIPLEVPFHIFIDPSAACNFHCKFCFNYNKKRTFHKIMKFELFEKIIMDLKEFSDKIKVLRLYKEGEPLLNRRLADMIKCAKMAEVSEEIDFTTNGSLLSSQKNIELINAGLDAIVISIEGLSKEKYFETSGVCIDFKELVKNIEHFYTHKGNCRVHIKTTDACVSIDEQEHFFKVFGDICDEISIDRVTPIWPNVDLSNVINSNDRGIYNQTIQPVKVCPYIFYSLTINSDGSVSSCFLDWEHTNIVGDVKKESFLDIWNGEKIYYLRKLHLEGKTAQNSVCNNCGQLIYGMADNIDDYSGDLLEKLIRRYRYE